MLTLIVWFGIHYSLNSQMTLIHILLINNFWLEKGPTNINFYPLTIFFSILVTPVLTQGANYVTAYFPKTNWYDFYTLNPVAYSGVSVTLPAPIGIIPVHIRGGSIIPLQIPGYTVYE